MMDWTDEVRAKLKGKNKVLFSKTSPFLQDLIALIEAQNHQTMVLWAFEAAEEAIKALEEKYPDEVRPRAALAAAKQWAAGNVKMPIAQRAILNCHAFAKEISSPADIALCHAVGQAVSVVHTSGHAIGFPIYDLTSIVYRLGIEHCKEPIGERKSAYVQRIIYWKNHYQEYKGTWAGFMLKT